MSTPRRPAHRATPPLAPTPPASSGHRETPRPVPIPAGTRKLLATLIAQNPNGQAVLAAFGEDSGIAPDLRFTLVIDAAHLEPAPQRP